MLYCCKIYRQVTLQVIFIPNIDLAWFSLACLEGVNTNAHHTLQIFVLILETMHLFPSALFCICLSHKVPVKLIFSGLKTRKTLKGSRLWTLSLQGSMFYFSLEAFMSQKPSWKYCLVADTQIQQIQFEPRLKQSPDSFQLSVRVHVGASTHFLCRITDQSSNTRHKLTDNRQTVKLTII